MINILLMIKSRNKFYFGLFVCLGFLVFACATKSEAYRDIDNAVSRNEFEQGIEVIKKSQDSKKPIYRKNNAISLYLDKGLLEHYAGNYTGSSADLQEAERLIQEAFTKSVSANLASYIANDNTKEYPGEDFEDIYINIFNALNYYNAGNIEGALVEIRKLTWASGKLDMLNRKYDAIDSKTSEGSVKQLNSGSINGSPDLPKKKPVEFSDSALARYLGALFYLGEGNADSARIEFARLQAAFAANTNVYSNPFPKSVEDAQNVPKDKARLNIIGFTGLSPIKEEQINEFYFPFLYNSILRSPRFKLPVLVKRPDSINRIEIVIGNEKFNLELLEDIGAVIEETYNARFSRTLIKTYIRTLVKYAAIDIAAIQTIRKTDSNIVAVLAIVSALAARRAFDATESADIRMSRYLPNKAYIGGINLDPGNYDIEICFYNGNQVITKEKRNVNVRANRLNLAEVINLK